MRAVLALLLLPMLAACSSPPPPPPPAPPPPPVPAIEMPKLKLVPPAPIGAITALRHAFDDAGERLRAYRELSRCVPSGPIACSDPKSEARAVYAEDQAREALRVVEQLQGALHTAKQRVATFQAAVSALPADDD